MKQVGVDDPFLISGGFVEGFAVLVRLRSEFPLLSMQDFYEHSTLAALERHLRNRACTDVVRDEEAIVHDRADVRHYGEESEFKRVNVLGADRS